tara:strand:+ start:472 stop:801 length:330 start_codon:yes stop_codon:yes gene_type:complete
MFKVHLVNLKNKIRTGCVRDLRHKVKRERDIPEILIIRGDNNVEEVISQNSYDECFNYECDIIRDDSDDENDSILDRGFDGNLSRNMIIPLIELKLEEVQRLTRGLRFR